MMKFDFSQNGASHEDLFGTKEELTSALKSFHKKKQGFLDSLDDDLKDVLDFAETNREKYEKIVVLGIGGSALGARMLADYFDNEKLLVLDTLDPHAVEKILKSIPLKKTLWIVVSKSGTTLETMTLRDMLKPGIPAGNWVIISEKDSALWEWAEEIKCPAFEMPKNVGGRFSVLTTIGMLPAALAGLPVEKLISGAKKMAKHSLSESVDENYAWQLASTIESFGREKIVHWAYCSALKTFGDWWTQLVAESLGKNGKGITPLAAIGPTDQHSLLQLVSEGDDNFFNIFVRDNSIERSPLGKIMNAELRATAQSLSELGRPSCILDIKNRNASTLGQLIVLWEMTTAFLGELRGIDAFNQPGVDRGKVLTKEFLAE
jgi:glucose-6-phosphate isomerase